MIDFNQIERLRPRPTEPAADQPLFGRRPRVAEVAARAGVSTATVDRVINARGGVRQKTVALVEKAIREIAAVDRARPVHAATFDVFLPANSGRSTEVLAEAITPRERSSRRASPRRVRRAHRIRRPSPIN